MALRDWVRPPRQLLVIFLAVAALSTAALGWLTWRLLEQDAQLETQRERIRLEQAADSAVAAMQQALGELVALATQPASGGAQPPADVTVVTIADGAVSLRPEGTLPYVALAPRRVEGSEGEFEDAERVEFEHRDLAGAARLYVSAARSSNTVVRAGALARLARVRRASHDLAGALEAYGRLEALGDSTPVFGLPATLVAKAGRLSALGEVGRTHDLRAAAESLSTDLGRGRWALARAEYEAYSAQALAHAPSSGADPRALARAEALDSIWQNPPALPQVSHRLIRTPHGGALAVWQGERPRINIVVAGPSFIGALCTAPSGSRCALTDLEGRPLTGDAPQNASGVTRVAASTKLPWMVHIVADGTAGANVSSSRRLLLAIFAGVALVLAAGWYFIVRSISREARVARLQTDFVAAVSHEFRSPLTSLSHISAMLAEDRVPSEELRRRSYGVLVRDTDRLRRLVETLLDFGRFESGATGLRLEHADIAALVREIVGEFQDGVRSQGYVVELNGAVESLMMPVDREALRRAVWNLLDNAVKYSSDARTVRVDVQRLPGGVSIAVSDDGLGIPVHERAEIFNRFVRGEESKARRIKGTGIGLALVRQIVLAHGGAIEVTSEVGRGSTFRIVLPRPAGIPEVSNAAMQPTRS